MAQNERLDYPPLARDLPTSSSGADPAPRRAPTDRRRSGQLRELYSGLGETLALTGTALIATVALITAVAAISWGWSGHRTPMVGLIVLTTGLGVTRLRRLTARAQAR